MKNKIKFILKNFAPFIVAIIFILIVFSPILRNLDNTKKQELIIVDTTYNYIVIDSIKYNIIVKDSIVYNLKQEMKHESEKVYTISDSANIKLFYELLSR